MENVSPKINIYQQRDFGAKITAVFEFIRENWKPLLKYIVAFTLPVSIVQSFCMNMYMQSSVFDALETVDTSTGTLMATGFYYGLTLICSMVGALVAYSLFYAMLAAYDRREERLRGITWKELSPDFFHFLRRGFVLMLFLFFAIIVYCAVTAMLAFAAPFTLILTLGFLLAFILTKQAIPILQRKQMGQNIRDEGPQSHMKKSGTPSMGGIAIIIAVVIAAIVGSVSKTSMADTLICLSGLIFFGAIGFFDDYLKVIKKQNEGLKPYQKFGLQFLFAVVIAVYMAEFSDIGTLVYIPFAQIYVDFGIFYIPFVIFTILAMTNGVNLTDGLDGLAAGVTTIVSLYMAYVASSVGHLPSELMFAALCGACIGFLAFNKNPAKIFMGDTGSLAIGGGITVAAFMMKMEFLLPIAGLIYVLETLSVILQVGYFKATGGKRLFRMAPLHHHFEEGGMHERKVVLMFWTVTLICCGLALWLA